jgi:hypothetical protein
VPRLDLVIADEAHRCAGKSDTVFGTVLNDRLINADRRLFATATPRIYRTSLKKAAEEFGVEVVDMSDEKSFGKRFHTLTFGEAIKREQLTDYRVLIVGVDDQRTREWIENRRLVATDTGHTTDAKSLAAQIGLLKAIKDWNLRRLISFHSRVKGARLFSEDIVQVSEWLDDAHRPSGHLRAEFVSGEMPTIERRQKLMRLKNVGNGDIGLLSNAKCLSEGVDVPALDGVAFIDPRSSEIDIIQSVGRAIRLSENKTMGTIVIPVFIEQTENSEEALAASDFKPIWDVLEALKSHDERLSDELDQLRIELGAKRRWSVGASDLTKIVFDLPTSVNENFAQSLRARLVEKATESWMFWFGLLERFVEERGHSQVVGSYKTEAGYSLGSWVTDQRALENQLEPDRRRRLEELPGWSWDPLSDQWEEGFAYLKEFSDQHDHCRVPLEYRRRDGYRLGKWVQTNRQRGSLDHPDRRKRLEALPGWSWNTRLERWEEGFALLKQFSDRHGHCQVPYHYEVENGHKLGVWVAKQRDRKSKMKLARKQLLEAMPGWSWAELADRWDRYFSKLQQFVDRRGSQVPHRYKTEDGLRLGDWVSRQKGFFRDGKLEPERQQRLEALPGWVWPRQTDRWEKGFAELKRFSDQEGHSRVPERYKTEDDFPLGAWVLSQRESKIDDPHRQQRLAALPDWAWTPEANRLEAQWEKGFANLKQFSEQEGHSQVPARYKTRDGYPLGVWASKQRGKKNDGTFPDRDRQQRLEALPGWSWSPQADRLVALWEKSFAKLKQFTEREGHSQVPGSYHSEDGYELGNWVRIQRVKKNDGSLLDRDRQQRLEALPGWIWSGPDKLTAAWEEGFANLKQFSEREGHCGVRQYYRTDEGFKLGDWVARQRRRFRANKLHPDQRQRLEALPGWVWKVRT